MKVLHVFKTYLPDNFGGIERAIWSIAEGTSALGLENHVFSLAADRNAIVAPLTIDAHISHKAKLDLYVASTGLSLSALGKFRELSATADVIHYHFPWPMMDLLHFAGSRGKPSILTYHSDIVRQKFLKSLYAPLMHAYLRSVDCIVATSPNYTKSSEVLGRYSDKTNVIPIGLAERVAPPDTLIASWRDRIGGDFFLFVGELRYYKGIDFLLAAAQSSGLPVVVAGNGRVSGTIPPNVKVLGPVTEADKEALLSLCRAFVFPSHLRSEAFGVALLEAARAGRPMISCEIGTGTSFVNQNGQTGLVIPPANVEALSDAMRRLSTDAELAQNMGQAARSRYLAHFTMEQVATTYKQLYTRIAGDT